MLTAMAALWVATACSSGGGAGGSTSDPAPPQDGNAAGAGAAAPPAETPTTAANFWKPPEDACAVVSREQVAALDLQKPQRDKTIPSRAGCKWKLGTKRGHQPNLNIHYSTSPTEGITKTVYDRSKRTDFVSGGGLGMRVQDRAEMRQIGSKVMGTDFDEGYYVYGIEEVVAGLKFGTGRLVLRKGNLLIEITHSGARITGKVNGRLISEPDPNEAAQQTLDKVADGVIDAAVRA